MPVCGMFGLSKIRRNQTIVKCGAMKMILTIGIFVYHDSTPMRHLRRCSRFVAA